MRYHNITKDDMLNGDGLRVVLWVSGCSHRCPGCQNPVTWDSDNGLTFDESAYGEIARELEKSWISGLTLSGGDPLYTGNLATIKELLCRVKKEYPNKTVWIYSGYKWEDVLLSDEPEMLTRAEIAKNCDVFIDGAFILAKKDVRLKWRGSSNQRVINVKSSLREGRVCLHCD